MSWIPAALSLVETGYGIYQDISAQQKLKKRPDYKIPPEVYAMLDLMKGRANTGLPGQDLMLENILSEGAGITSQLRESAAGGASLQGAIADLGKNQYKALTDLEIMNSQFKDQAKVDYGRALMEMADYKDRAWDYNVNQPFIQSQTEAYNQQAAGNQNIMGGLSSLSELAFLGGGMKSLGAGAGAGAPGTKTIGSAPFSTPELSSLFAAQNMSYWDKFGDSYGTDKNMVRSNNLQNAIYDIFGNPAWNQ